MNLRVRLHDDLPSFVPDGDDSVFVIRGETVAVLSLESAFGDESSFHIWDVGNVMDG